MIKEIKGDLLKAEADALVNTVNTVGVMGKGIALQFKQAFPENYDAYRRACDRGEVRLGRMFVFHTGQFRPRFIINFPTKQHWRSKSRLADIKAGLVDLARIIRELEIESIAVPPLGAGNGGLPWPEVRRTIANFLGELPNTEVLLFTPSGAPSPDRMSVATRRPRMTPGRAALLGILHRYLEPEAGESAGITLLEIQKLMYLLQEAGEPLRLRFEAARYGPYAENLNHVLQTLEGHYLKGYGDRSRRVKDAPPLVLMPGAAEEAADFLRDCPETKERFDRVVSLIRGFESPYGLELLATIHWVATRVDREASVNADTAVRLVKQWSPRKGRLFTDTHIRLAWDQLRNEGWLVPSASAR